MKSKFEKDTKKKNPTKSIQNQNLGLLNLDTNYFQVYFRVLFKYSSIVFGIVFGKLFVCEMHISKTTNTAK